MSRHARRRRWKRASRARTRRLLRSAQLQHLAQILGRQIVVAVENRMPGLATVGVAAARHEMILRECAVRITDVDCFRSRFDAIPLRDIVDAIYSDIDRQGPVQFLELPKDPMTLSVVATGLRASFRVAFTYDAPRCLFTLRVIYLLRKLPQEAAPHELRFIGGPKDGDREHWPARSNGEHVVHARILPKISIAAVAEAAFKPLTTQVVTYREKRRMHMSMGRDEWGMPRPSRLLYVEMEVAP